MDSSALISVIVPIYNVEQYLDRCIESIIQQSYSHLEIILVDDGSPDQCPQICDEWAIKDQRIKVIHKENGGLSDARNAGLAEATGDYISFVDSDDWLNGDFYKNLLEVLDGYDCEAADCDYVVTDHLIEDQQISSYDVHTYTRNESMSMQIDNELKQVVWNKLYKASIVKNLMFEKGKYHEDEFYTYQVIARIKRFGHIDYVGYNYFQRSDSIMGDGYSLKRLDAIEAKVRRQNYLDEYMPELSGKGRVNLLFTCLFHGQNALKHLSKDDCKQAFLVLSTVTKTYFPQKEDIKNLTFKRKLWVHVSHGSFKLACKMRNLFHIGF